LQVEDLEIRDARQRGRRPVFRFPYGPLSGWEVAAYDPNLPVLPHDLGPRLYGPSILDTQSWYGLIMDRMYDIMNEINIEGSRAEILRDVPISAYLRSRIPRPTPLLLLAQEPYTVTDLGTIGNYQIVGTQYTEIEAGIRHFDYHRYADVLFESMMRAPRDRLPRNSPLIRLATYIYKSLYINYPEGKALFSLKFHYAERYAHPFLPRGSQTFINVFLSQDTLIQYTNVLYIAFQIARRFHIWAIQYNIPEETEFPISKVTIKQIILPRHNLFSHVIRSIPKNLTIYDIMALCKNSREPIIQRQFKILFNKLEGKVLSSPYTIKNCVGSAIYLAKRNIIWENLSKISKEILGPKIAKSSSKMFNGLKSRKLSDIIFFLQNKYRKGKIIFRDSSYKIVAQCLGDLKGPTLEILIMMGHAFAILPKGDGYTTTHLWEPFQSKKIPTINYNYECYDIETTYINSKPFLIGMTHENEYIDFCGKYCIENFIDYVGINMPSPLSFIGHNAGKFDIYPVAKAIKNNRNWRISDILDHNGRCLRLVTIYFIRKGSHRGKYKVFKWEDSFPLISYSLKKACKIYKTTYQKLTGTVDYRTFNEYSWQNPKIRKYCKYDVLSLKELLFNWNKVMENKFTFKPLGLCLTRASIIKTLFLGKYYDEDKYPLYEIPYELDKIFRQGYFGGRSEIMAKGEFFNEPDKNLFLFDEDRISSYPAELLEDLPYDIPVYKVFNTIPQKFHGYVDFIVKGGSKIFPNVFRYRSKARGVITPIFLTPTRLLRIVDEVLFALKYNHLLNYEIEILGGYSFLAGPFMKQITLDIWDIKRTTPKSSPEYDATKVSFNSLYGFFGRRRMITKIIVVHNPAHLVPYLATGNLLDWNYPFAKVRMLTGAKLRNVAVAATITSKAHCALLQRMYNVILNKGILIACDTDGFKWKGPPGASGSYGTNIGDWKLETTNITSIVSVAPKKVGIKTTTTESVKCAGFPLKPFPYHTKTANLNLFSWWGHGIEGSYTLAYEDLKMMLNGVPLEFNVERFILGKNTWITTENQLELSKRIQNIKITGKIFKGKLKKDGRIRPWYLTFLREEENLSYFSFFYENRFKTRRISYFTYFG